MKKLKILVSLVGILTVFSFANVSAMVKEEIIKEGVNDKKSKTDRLDDVIKAYLTNRNEIREIKEEENKKEDYNINECKEQENEKKGETNTLDCFFKVSFPFKGKDGVRKIKFEQIENLEDVINELKKGKKLNKEEIIKEEANEKESKKKQPDRVLRSFCGI